MKTVNKNSSLDNCLELLNIFLSQDKWIKAGQIMIVFEVISIYILRKEKR